MEIALRPEDKQMLDEKVASGRFSSADEAVAAALELLRRREDAELETLRMEVRKGFDQIEAGDYVSVTSEKDAAELTEQIHRRGLARAEKEQAAAN